MSDNTYAYVNAAKVKRDLLSTDPKSVLLFDTETTGVEKDDEILQLSIVDLSGRIIFDRLIRPLRHSTWESAQEIHGIDPSQVKNIPDLSKYHHELNAIFSQATFIGAYNFPFDYRMLAQSGYDLTDVASKAAWIDVMYDYASIAGETYSDYGDYLWQSLESCAEHYDYDYEAHDAVNDARATAFCLGKMLEDPHYELHAVFPKNASMVG